jgi:hypothetical protein
MIGRSKGKSGYGRSDNLETPDVKQGAKHGNKVMLILADGLRHVIVDLKGPSNRGARLVIIYPEAYSLNRYSAL